MFDLSHIPGMTLFMLEMLMHVYNFVFEESELRFTCKVAVMSSHKYLQHQSLVISGWIAKTCHLIIFKECF